MVAVTERTNIWKNSDGLRVATGLASTEKALVGAPRQAGSFLVLEAIIRYDEMAAFGTNQFVNAMPTACIPAGALLVEARLEVLEAFDSAGDALTLTLGMAKQDGTVIDADGIDATIAQASIDAVGDTITCDGAMINTVLANDSYPTVQADTATATAGKARLIFTFMKVGDMA